MLSLAARRGGVSLLHRQPWLATPSFNRRLYSGGPDIDDTVGNVGRKREVSAASVSAGDDSATALSASQQGLQGEAALATLATKRGPLSASLKHHRLKLTPFGGRFDPFYVSSTYNQGPYSFTAEGSPGGFGLLSGLLGIPLPYLKLIAAKKFASGGQLALATGFPFINYTSPAPPSASGATLAPSLPTTTTPAVVPSSTASLSTTPTAEEQQLIAAHEAHPDYDPLAR
jgi:hypothetical protein